jgi:hypothetical protein
LLEQHPLDFMKRSALHIDIMKRERAALLEPHHREALSGDELVQPQDGSKLGLP